ncbi:MAG: response regulator, partial [Desulfomonilia bacterium]|nr:response regulator [Desulfomonilia bacterium]
CAMNDQRPSVLVVDDEIINSKMIVHMLQQQDYRIAVAVNGEEAWGLLQKTPDAFDAVLLDRMMPGIDGIEVLKRMKRHDELKGIPVIIQTAMTEETEILKGIQAGAFYYLTKPYRKERLLTVVKAAIDDHDQYKILRKEAHHTAHAFSLLIRADFSLKSLGEVDNLAAFLAKLCPEPDKAVLGLWELLINALEHGNLGITYEEKSELIRSNIWREEVNRRSCLEENQDKRVLVRYEKSEDDIVFTIEDMGPGFDWEPYLELRPDRVFDSHGRGIAIAGNYSFDRLEYLGPGNKVRAVIKGLRPGEGALLL